MIREVTEKEKKEFDKLAIHPMQSWEWGEFRKKTGVSVLRLGRFDNDKLVETAQITFHPIPKLPWRVGYWPKGIIPSAEMMKTVIAEARKRKAILVKMEPNIIRSKVTGERLEEIQRQFKIVEGKPMFTKWSFWLDLTPAEEKILAGMKQKTRYNTRLAERKGVKIVEDNSEAAFEEYWKLTEETTRRQGFYAHTKRYHQLMFETLRESGIAHMFRAIYEEKTLATWIVFLLNGVIYYPYGASTRDDKNVFASNLLMWEMIKYGKKNGSKLFDMWGSLPPKYDPKDPWAGFHRFKEGYGGDLVEFLGTYDLMVDPKLYWLYRAGNDYLRWWFLKLKARFSKK
jgi:lipid II:glycine glycyltransferase (peptidoglycan interpeptide bridge formation enzyme)